MSSLKTFGKCPICNTIMEKHINNAGDVIEYACPECGYRERTEIGKANYKTNSQIFPVKQESTTGNSMSNTIDNTNFGFIRQGWQCPKCGAILAPNQTFCPFCAPRPNTVNDLRTFISPTVGPLTGFDNIAVSNKQ